MAEEQGGVGEGQGEEEHAAAAAAALARVAAAARSGASEPSERHRSATAIDEEDKASILSFLTAPRRRSSERMSTQRLRGVYFFFKGEKKKGERVREKEKEKKRRKRDQMHSLALFFSLFLE